MAVVAFFIASLVSFEAEARLSRLEISCDHFVRFGGLLSPMIVIIGFATLGRTKHKVMGVFITALVASVPLLALLYHKDSLVAKFTLSQPLDEVSEADLAREMHYRVLFLNQSNGSQVILMNPAHPNFAVGAAGLRQHHGTVKVNRRGTLEE